MELRTLDFCHAEVILNANFGVKQEILQILQTLNCSWTDPDADPPHRVIKAAFAARGWRPEVLVSNRTLRRHRFDLYKERVAIELEFSQREMFYRDYFRFLLAEREGMIDVGVIITRDAGRNLLDPYAVEPLGVRADIQQARDDLSWMRSMVKLPMWVIGVS